MADDVDLANADTERITDLTLEAIRKQAVTMPIGEQGECPLCEEYSLRLVGTLCARCRDKYKLP